MPATLTTEQFLVKARNAHPNLDYSKVEYTGSQNKIEVICQEHGSFWIQPDMFIRGKGCKTCNNFKKGLAARSNTEDFINKARIIHGNKFDYSKVEYKKCDIPVKIGCPIHGFSFQEPSDHLKGFGCTQCGNTKPNGNYGEKFLKVMQGFFPNLDYSKTIYKSAKELVTITCPTHGDFEKTPDVLMRGIGCNECSKLNPKSVQKRQEPFIEKLKILYPTYNFDNVIYKGTNKNVSVICPIHGSFDKLASSLLQGAGCQKCSHIKQHAARCNTTEWFIEEAANIHGNTYNYDNTVYVKSNNKVAIECEHHGIFYQTPCKHLMGRGCPTCNSFVGYSRTQWEGHCKGRVSYVYLLRLITPNEICLKIGVTIQPYARYRSLGYQNVNVEEINRIEYVNSDDSFNAEKYFFKHLKEYKYTPEHIFDGCTECFIDNPIIIEEFQNFKDKSSKG